jgi:hypothetical protein
MDNVRNPAGPSEEHCYSGLLQRVVWEVVTYVLEKLAVSIFGLETRVTGE